MLSVLRLLALAALCRLAFPQGQNQLDASPTLFTVMAAINSAGYDVDLDSPSNHPLRAAVRKAIAARHPASLEEIRRFYQAHTGANRGQQLSQYISFGLCLKDPPSFEFRYEQDQLPPDVRALAGFEVLLKKFYEEAQVGALWRQAQPALEALLARYQPVILKDVQQVNLYLRTPGASVRFKRFQIYIEPLGAPNVILTRSYVDDYFVVLTPSPEPDFDQIRRAYLHYLIDPLMLMNAEKLDKKRPLIDLAQASPVLDDAYKEDFSLLAGMSLVRAVEARLSPASAAGRQAQVDRAVNEGFILAAYFYEALPAFEKDVRSLRFYVGEMIDGIDLAKEDKRLANVEFVSKRTERVVRAAPAEKPAPQTGLEKTLADAEQLYEKRDLPAAKAAYRQALKTEGPKAAQARAYYGLARIAVLEKDSVAETLFEHALELDPEPAVKAWLHIYLARLAAADEEFDRALEHYKAALAVDGISETARGYAQRELQAVEGRLKQ